MPVDSTAPTTEIGTSSNVVGGFNGNPGGQSSFTFIDTYDYAAKMLWPNRFEPVQKMLTDSQIEGLRQARDLPIRGFRWYIDPEEARDVVVQGVAKDLGLPIKGQKDFKRGRRKGRFSHGAHLTEAQRALDFGFNFFEQFGEIGADELWHLRKLAPRSPRTMVAGQIHTARDGGLVDIVQGVGQPAKPIPVGRLAAYVWDGEAGNWTGRSMLRHCLRPWMAKDVAFRVGPLNIERNGMGVPIIEAPPGATAAEIEALAAMAQQYRSGERAGGAIPSGAKLTLQGVQGTTPDSTGFMRFCNEEMATGFLAMFMELGKTESGSRALGEVHLDFYSEATQAIANWYAEITTAHVIEDWVDWNYGEDEGAPSLGWERVADEDMDIQALALMVKEGVIQVDPELEEDVRSRLKAPARPDNAEPTPELDPVPAGQEIPSSPSDPQAPPATAASATGERRRSRTVAAASSSLSLPDRPLRRQPYSQEVQAKVDYQLMDAQMQTLVDKLVGEVSALQAGQIDELEAQIKGADGDLAQLAALEATPAFKAVIEDAMLTMAAQGVEQAVGEATRQGIEPKTPELDSDAIINRAGAVDTLLSRSLSEAAGRKAMSLTGGSLDAAVVAADVKTYLSGLTTTYLQEQLGGTLVQAMNTGRKAVFAENPPKSLYASELLDENACEECVAIDGTEYETLEAAEADYPTGGYCECLGGPRCRGTLVAVHVDEEEPSE